jgi:hypothetical protein
MHIQGVKGHHKGPKLDRIQRSELKDSHERKPNGVHHLDCKVFSSNQSTSIRIMDLGVEKETMAGLRDQMTSHNHLCY